VQVFEVQFLQVVELLQPPPYLVMVPPSLRILLINSSHDFEALVRASFPSSASAVLFGEALGTGAHGDP